MDRFQQLNKKNSQDGHNSIKKSEISAFDSRNSSKEDKQHQQDFTKSKNPTSKSKKYPTVIRAAKSAASESKLHNKQPSSQLIRSEVESISCKKEHTNKKMSDWGDEETTEEIGKGFGNNNDVYKNNKDDDYQNEDDNYKEPFNSGGGGRGGRNFGGRGRGGRSGNGFNRYNKNNDANEENGESSAFANITGHEYSENSIFALTPKDFLKETLQYFMLNMPELFRKASLVQKYTLSRYLMEAYERVLKRFSETNNRKQKPSTKTEKEKNAKQLQLQTTADEAVSVPNLRGDVLEEDAEMLPVLSSLPSSQSGGGAVDLLQIFQQDFNKESNEQISFGMQENIPEFQENVIILTPPPPQLSPMNISDLFGNDNLSSSSFDDLQISFRKLHQPSHEQQQQQPSALLSTTERRQGDVTLRRSERLQVIQNSACAENQAQTRISAQRLRYSFRSPAKPQPSRTTTASYLTETPPATSKRSKPRTFITEKEYSLRFRLPRRKFVEISELPHVKFNIETSSFSYFPMDMTLIEEEYLSGSDNANNLVAIQLSEASTLLAPQPFTTSALATTTVGDNLSSLNVVRQAPSSLMELSSFARPLLQPTVMDISRIEEERRNSVALKDIMSPHIQPAGLQNKDVNVSFDSATSSTGAVAIAGESPPQPRPQEPNIIDEDINLPGLEPQKITTDSGIQFPTPNLLTTDSTLVLPSFSKIDSEPRTAARDGKPPPETVSSGDTGIFKTPMIPAHKLQQPTTTLSSETDERLFQSQLIKRTLDVSTPLKVLEGLQTRKTLLAQIEAETPGNIVDVQSEEAVTTAAAAREQQVLQPIEEMRESNIRPLNGQGDGELQNLMQNVATVEPINPTNGNENANDDDYRKDWYEILRARLQSNNYENTTTPHRKPKHRRPRKRLPLTQQIKQQEQLEQQTNASSSNLLQQTLAGILPPLTSESSPKQILNTTTSSTNSIKDAAAEVAPVISPQQQQYDQFILDNAENITLIMNNLNSCRIMLENHRRGLQAKINSDSTQQPCQHFDPTVLINAPKTRLSVKLGLLQNIIRQVSFDFTKCDFIKDRMSAAIAFAFLLELKSAGIIHLSSDGRVVSLH